MGTFIGHFVPALAFILVGLWHTLNTIKAYKLKGPSHFTSTTWFPLSTSIAIPKRLELYLLFSFSVFAIILQLIDYPLLTFSFKPDNYEHATIFLHVAIYSSVALAVDYSSSSESFLGLVGALATSVFGQELFLLHFHSIDHAGLEGHYHWLLELIVATSLVATAISTGFPTSFPAAMVRSVSVLFQGLWFMVMGFALWVPSLVPKGCHATGSEGAGGHGAVACGTEEASRRAMALANLQFSWVLAGVLVLTAYLCLRPEWKCMEYRQLQCRGVDVSQVSGEGEAFKGVHASA
ncbi:uncharacterized protein [Elaeis guineensis]|uniref:Transmembrane protein 45A n=1 Tax=Elaeis guineensis var. tenera TaxID=51953 RepID=A0A6I9R3I2_ELAGV|nr:transmembrane protein 45A [Elaeis guineensis]